MTFIHDVYFLLISLAYANLTIVEHGSSNVECRTRNQESPGSNSFCYHFEVWAFSLSPQNPSSLSCINKYMGMEMCDSLRE